MRSKLSNDFRITEYPDGALIQAGLRSQMGDLEKGAIPELYALFPILEAQSAFKSLPNPDVLGPPLAMLYGCR